MPERLSNAEIRTMLERADAATPGPWYCEIDGWPARDTDTGFLPYYAAGINNSPENPYNPYELSFVTLEFVAHARSDVPTLARELLACRESLREVRRRMIKDYYTGSAPDSPHFWSCQVCTWVWKGGEPELHEPTCPLALAAES